MKKSVYFFGFSYNSLSKYVYKTILLLELAKIYLKYYKLFGKSNNYNITSMYYKFEGFTINFRAFAKEPIELNFTMVTCAIANP